MSNNPISFVDPDGGWDFGITYYVDGMRASMGEAQMFLNGLRNSGENFDLSISGFNSRSSGNFENGLRLNQIYAHFQGNPFGADTFLGLEYDFTDIFNNTLSYYSDKNI